MTARPYAEPTDQYAFVDGADIILGDGEVELRFPIDRILEVLVGWW